jgi:hypothetical protein
MIAAIPMIWPDWAALKRQVMAVMDVILHIGAHRTGTTTFQDYMRNNSQGLAARDIAFWGPRRTRGGLFAGIQPGARVATGRDLQKRALGRVRMNCARVALRGARHLVVSDENMIGSVGENLMSQGLYLAVGERMARFALAFQGQKTRIFLSIRALDHYWASSLGYGITRGFRMPTSDTLDLIAGARRSWRDVITDVACAVPDAKISVLPFETYGGQPDAQLAQMTGGEVPRTYARGWFNATPQAAELAKIVKLRGEDCGALNGTGRWQPFDAAQIAAMRDTYLDDLFWLHSGADGLATFTEEKHMDRTGNNPAARWYQRGRSNELEKRPMVTSSQG